MAEIDSVHYAVWNAGNALGDNRLSESRMYGAIEVVKQVGADVIYVSELASKITGREILERERLEWISDQMRHEGYGLQVISNYTDVPGVRDPSYQAMFSRGVGQFREDAISYYGERYGMTLYIHEMRASLSGVHLDDQDDRKRVTAVREADARAGGSMRRSLHAFAMQVQEPRGSAEEAAIGGDLNTADLGNPVAWPMWALGRAGVGNIELKEFYNDANKLVRYIGFLIRAARMGVGEARHVLEELGYHQVNTRHEATCFNKGYALPVDDIYLSQGLEATETQVHGRTATPNGTPVSDHKPVSTVIRRAA